VIKLYTETVRQQMLDDAKNSICPGTMTFYGHIESLRTGAHHHRRHFLTLNCIDLSTENLRCFVHM
jgi:hypothetical protein